MTIHQFIHVLTPGDHFSPRTGSAVATVVDGLASGASADLSRHTVLLARGTYPDRYSSADAVEYDQARRRRGDRVVDALMGRLGLGRPGARRGYRAALAEQRAWAPATVVLHNAVQGVGLVDVRHQSVLHAHNDLFRSYSRREAAQALDRVGAIIAVSEFLASRIRSALPGHLGDRVRVVHHGVDTARFRPLARSDQYGATALRVVLVGRVVPDKGAETLVRAVLALGRDDVHLTVVGSAGFDAHLPLSSFEQHLRRLAAPAGDRITFQPFVPRDQAAEIMGRAEVVVVPSQWAEPFALTVLEGMAAGAAVVASDVGGIPEAAGGAAMLVPPGDVGALTEALEALADDRALLAGLRAQGLARASARTWKVASAEFHAALAHLR